jgi:DNA ligase-1
MSLKHIYEAIQDIAAYSGRIDKENCIEKYKNDPLFKAVVHFAVNPFKKYNMTSVDYIPEHVTEEVKTHQTNDNIFKMLNYLESKNGATNADKLNLNLLASIDRETAEVVNMIVAKDLRCGANSRTFRKIFPDIPEFGLMLCEDEFKKFEKKIKIDKVALCDCMWSIKLDGVRNYCVSSQKIQHLSRNGREYPNFGKAFNEHIHEWTKICRKQTGIREPIMDGETISKCDNFQNLMTQVKKLKDADPSIFNFFVFDLAVPNIKLKQRYEMLVSIFDEFQKLGDSNIFLLEHKTLTNINTEQELYDFSYSYSDQGYEGLVIKNPESYYEPKRSANWLKIKKFKSLDLPVIGWEYGKGKYEDLLGYFICDYNGVKVEVGSGLSDAQREEFMEDTPKLIEVKYFEETKDKSLRFPIFLRVRDDK